MAIVVVNPNPVFDRTIVVERLVPGTVMRTLEVEVTAGGKGVNVARALRALQVPATLIAPVGRDGGQRYERLLAEEGADVEAFDVSGFVRIASIYRESTSDRVTVVNDAGHLLPETEWDAFVEFAADRVQSKDLVLVMGSLPAGLPADAAARLVRACHARGARVILDTAPTWLTSAMSAHPDLVAPNIHEAHAAVTSSATSVFDDSTVDDARARAEAMELAGRCAEKTTRMVCVTVGSAGVAFSGGDERGWIDAPSVDVVSAVGAGDSFVAGLAARWHHDLESQRDVDWPAAVGFGVACASTSCEVVRAGGVERSRALHIAAEMGVAEVEAVGAR